MQVGINIISQSSKFFCLADTVEGNAFVSSFQ